MGLKCVNYIKYIYIERERILHGHAGIRNFSSSVEKYFMSERTTEIFFQHEKRNLVSPSGHGMFYLLYKNQ